MARRRKKGHGRGRKGRSLKRRYGRSGGPSGSIRMNVTGQLVLDPEKLEEVVEKAIEIAVQEAVPEAVEEAVEESVPEAVSESLEDLEGVDHYGGYGD